MTLRDRIKVEALDEERLTNIERRLVVGVSELKATPQRARFPFAFALGSLVAVAGAALIGWKLHTPAVIEQPVAIAPTPVTIDRPVPTVAQLELHDGSKIVAAGAELTGEVALGLTTLPSHTSIDMARGTLSLSVVHDPSRILVVHAGDTEIQDVGTRFRVDYDGANSVEVRVTEGEVKVTRNGIAVEVTVGSAWTTAGGLTTIAALDHPVVATAAQRPVVAPHPVQTQHVVEHVAVPVDRTTAPLDPFLELRAAIRKVPLDYAPAIDGHTDAATEIAKLKKIAYSPTTLGPEASKAMYEIAVLLYRPLGQDAEALRTLDVYQRRFARGKEMHAAMWLHVRIACGHTVDEDCRRAAYSYQHEVTSGEASDVAIRITNAP